MPESFKSSLAEQIRDPTSTQLVFHDLGQLFFEICDSRRRPNKFRVAFEQYVTKSQQLTEAMRREFSRLTGTNWVASKFTGWNEFTDLLKKIRAASYHGVPIQMHEVFIGVYPNVDAVTDRSRSVPVMTANSGSFRVLKGVSFVTMPCSERILTPGVGIPVVVRDPGDSKDPGNYIFPVKEFVSYELTWELLESNVRASARNAGTTDVVRIVLRSWPTLRRYYQFYCEQLDENQLDHLR